MKEIKFLVNSMLGKLSRLLRIFSYDTVYANDLIVHFNLDPVPDDKLLEFGLKEERIIVTRDYILYKKAKDNGFYLEGEGVYNYLKQLKIKLNLDYNFDIKRARCSICNSELKKVDKKLIKELIESETFKYHNNFYQCPNSNCKKIYWKGTHIENIIEKLNNKKL